MTGDDTSGGADFGFRRLPDGEKAPFVRAVFDSLVPRYDLIDVATVAPMCPTQGETVSFRSTFQAKYHQPDGG
jgi:hypothetical protein